jgi:hypothetical protein
MLKEKFKYVAVKSGDELELVGKLIQIDHEQK